MSDTRAHGCVPGVITDRRSIRVHEALVTDWQPIQFTIRKFCGARDGLEKNQICAGHGTLQAKTVMT